MRSFVLTLLLAWGTVVAAGPLPAQQSRGVEAPPVDVEANVRRMLDEGRGRPGVEAPAAEDSGNGEAAPATKALPPRSPASAAGDNGESDHVPVPEMTITVRSKGDVKAVAQELEAAAARKKSAAETTGPTKP